MKARFFRLVAVPTVAVFLSAIGCIAADTSDPSSDPSVVDEPETMSAEAESAIPVVECKDPKGYRYCFEGCKIVCRRTGICDGDCDAQCFNTFCR
jgi:hypothetical protein